MIWYVPRIKVKVSIWYGMYLGLKWKYKYMIWYVPRIKVKVSIWYGMYLGLKWKYQYDMVCTQD